MSDVFFKTNYYVTTIFTKKCNSNQLRLQDTILQLRFQFSKDRHLTSALCSAP